MEITASGPVKSVELRPRSRAVKAALDGKTVRFTLSRPCKLCVEWNGSDKRPLFLFAGGMESYPGGIPRPGQAGVRYFGPGAHEAGEIRPQSGETVYIAGGAVVYGKIAADGAKGVRVLGRGILDGSRWKQWETSLVSFRNCADIEVRGVILRDSPSWTVVPARCDRVTVADVKILNYRKNSDGINAVNSRQVTIDDCFVRNYDDSIVVKATEADARDVEDITVRNCVVWCDWGFSLGMTYEARVPRIRRLVFEDCDVLHGMACRGALGVKNGDRATVSEVRFDNIRVEDARVQLLELIVDRDMWSKDDQRGRIQGVLFRNIALTGGPFAHSTLAGHDAEHRVEDVTFENLRIHGNPVATAEQGKIRINAHVKDVRFLPGGSQASGAEALSFLPEMETPAGLAGVLNPRRLSEAEMAKHAREAERAIAQWKKLAPTLAFRVTPEKVRELSRWARPQMEQYKKVPSLEKVQLALLGADAKGERLILGGTIDTLPSHHPLVTRWLKVYLVYDSAAQTVDRVVVTIRGERLE